MIRFVPCTTAILCVQCLSDSDSHSLDLQLFGKVQRKDRVKLSTDCSSDEATGLHAISHATRNDNRARTKRFPSNV